MIELLSPAGNIEKLRTAINYGADACYMGLNEFSLRANAGNFSPEELEEVRRIKRESGKKLYCAMNILFKEDQIEKLYTMKDEIASWPFDAFIISDIGLVDFFQKYLPDRDLHLSTQASCINSSSVKAYRNMGFKRIILGRESLSASSMGQCAWHIQADAYSLHTLLEEVPTRGIAHIHAAGTIRCMHLRKRREKDSTCR